MAIKNYTTSIASEKTVMEIQSALAKHRASAILTEYDDDGVISALSFKLRMPHGEVPFKLPVNIEGVLRTLCNQRDVPKRLRTREQASRVAWRVLKDWITAQLAIVEAQMVEMAEVFLPYADAGDGRTLYQHMLESPGNLLSYTPDEYVKGDSPPIGG